MTQSEQVVPLLESIAVYMELKGENPFKIRAYQNAARSLSEFRGDLKKLCEEKKLTEIKGIGKGIATDLEEYFAKGKISQLEELKRLFPSSLLELLSVPGLGPKKVKKLYEELHIHSLGELEYACKENRLLKLEGFGQKTQEKIAQGIQFLKKHSNSFLFFEAQAVAQKISAQMRKWKEIKELSIAGSLRRKKEVVHDVDIVCAADKSHAAIVMEKFSNLAGVQEVLARGDTKTSVRIDNIQMDLRVVEEKEYPFALHHFTGSKEHNTQLRAHAKKLGYTLNEYGLFKGDKWISCDSEQTIYAKLGMDYIPTELREGRGEIDLALSHKLPELIEGKDIQGIFHVHTLYSDGKNTIEEMVKKAVDNGYRYIGISDHSQSAFYAHGLKEVDLSKQQKEIDQVSKKFPGIRIFRGIESDILPDGSLDYPEKILRKFDFIVASVHSSLKMTREEMTERCVRALSNPYCTFLGHPTGRLLLAREGFSIDLARIVEAAKKYGKIIELNANPHRLDIDWRYLDDLKSKGIMVSIHPDAHEVEGIDDVEYGVSMARKGGLSKKHVFNTKSTKEVEQYLASSKSTP